MINILGYLIFMLPAFLLSVYAQARVSSNFNRYSNVRNRRGVSGAEAARILLRNNGINGVEIEPVKGSLSDHYDPRSRTLRLSESVYGSASIAALGVAAHEVGHAIQHDRKYTPLELRHAIVPVANFASGSSWIILLLGFWLQMSNLVLLGIGLFSVVVLFHIVTLPVELNASHRALVQLDQAGLITEDEKPMVRKVLSAAALTYLAAVVSAIANLLWYLMIFTGSDD